MDNFKIIYKILYILEKSMDFEEFNPDSISHEALRITHPRWCRLINQLLEEGYISGIVSWKSMECDYPKIKVIRPEITLKGLEYLQENNLMKKAADLAKGVIDAAL